MLAAVSREALTDTSQIDGRFFSDYSCVHVCEDGNAGHMSCWLTSCCYTSVGWMQVLSENVSKLEVNQVKDYFLLSCTRWNEYDIVKILLP